MIRRPHPSDHLERHILPARPLDPPATNGSRATEDEIGAIALRAAYAYGRSAGLRAFDPPVGT
jgi:hypothetical protein